MSDHVALMRHEGVPFNLYPVYLRRKMTDCKAPNQRAPYQSCRTFRDSNKKNAGAFMTKLHIFGSIICDLVGTGSTLPQRDETILGQSFAQYPGGKGANQAVAAQRAGASTVLYGAVGRDVMGRFMLDALTPTGVDLTQIQETDAATGCALVMVGDGTNQIMVIPGANHHYSWHQMPSFTPSDVLLSQGECQPDDTLAFLRAGKAAGALTLFNAAPASAPFKDAASVVDILIVNEVEAAFFAGGDVSPVPSRMEMMALNKRLGRNDDQPLIITLGPAGAVSLIAGTYATHAAPQVKAIDTVGAGDCFCGYLAAQLGEGARMADAIDVAIRAASLSVQTAGAIPSLPLRAAVQ